MEWLNSQPEEYSEPSTPQADENSDWPFHNIDESLIGNSQNKRKLTRQEKRAIKAGYNRQPKFRHFLDMSSEKFQEMQQNDPTLKSVLEAARGNPSTAGVGFFERDGLVYRRWVPPRQNAHFEIEQLILPQEC